MLNKKEIRRLTNSVTYNRGQELFYNDGVETFEADDQDPYEIRIRARVQGSGRKHYQVEMTYDRMIDDLEDCYCECPAFYSYEGICKHCVAVLLEAEHYQFRQQTIQDFLETQLQDADKKYLKDYIDFKAGFDKSPAIRQAKTTTPAMKELLQKQTVRATMALLPQKDYGRVELEPYFECSKNSLNVEFKLGVDTKYVMKDVFEFVRHVESEAEYSYGKKLKFFHTLDAFEPKSREMVQFLIRWVQENGGRYVQYSYGGYYSSSYTRLRKIPLSSANFEELLECLKDRDIIMNANLTGERSWRLTEDKLIRKMWIKGEKDGIEIRTEGELFGYICSHYIVMFKEGLIYREKREELEQVQDFISCMAQLPDRKIYIAKEDVPVFCRELLPALEEHYQCEKADFDPSAYGVVPVSFEIYLDTPQKDFITCKVYALYGERKYEVFGNHEEKGGRDVVRETLVRNVVASYCNAFDEAEHAMVLSGDEDKLYELLVDGIPRFQELGEVYVSDTLKKIHVVQHSRVEVGVSLSGDLLELTVSAGEMSREELIEILSKYDRRKKYFRLKNGSFINAEDEGMQTLLGLKEDLNLTESQLKKEKMTVPKYRAMYLDSELREKQNLLAIRSRTFKELVRNMKTIEDNDFEIPASLEPVLREYQKTGFLWLKTLRCNGFGGILADDMGLGKTLQVIAFLLSEFLDAKAQDNRRCLIVTPASLVFNWNSEFRRFAPLLPVKMVTGTAAERKEIIETSQMRDILVTSYELLKRDLSWYQELSFFCQIIDEAQYIKNHNTQAAKAVKEIKAGCRFALTGTPIENKLSELWSIFDYLMPGFLFGYQRFRTEMEVPALQNKSDEAMERLQKMVKPFILRRLKRDVLTDLPDKLEECIYGHMEGEQWKLYCAHVQRIKMLVDKQSDEEFKSAKIQILSELLKLRQLCCDPSLVYENYESSSQKAMMCLDLIRNAVSGGHKVLLFSQFTSMLENLQRELDKENLSYYTLTGATPKEKRLKLVESFNRDETNVFCISLKAGGTGLNLTAADIVIHYDPWWNLAVQNQATDRAHRIGQKNVVNVYKLIMKDTIEENIVKLQEKKKELAEQVLSGEGMGSGSFSREELLELLKM